jgi:hypothetical protein
MDARGRMRWFESADWTARLAGPYPVANRRLTTGDFMGHLVAHLAYHAGQVDFHRRIVTGDASGVGAVSPAELSSARPIER